MSMTRFFLPLYNLCLRADCDDTKVMVVIVNLANTDREQAAGCVRFSRTNNFHSVSKPLIWWLYLNDFSPTVQSVL